MENVIGRGGRVEASFDDVAAVRAGAPCLWSSLAAVAERSAAALAVDDGQTRWTYGELHRLAAAVGGMLTETAPQPGALVALLMDVEAAAVAGMLGTIRAGHAYVGADPKHPDDWLRRQLARLGVGVVITTADRVERARTLAPAGSAVMVVPSLAGPGASLLAPANVDADAPACVISTSGSTGEPKGAIKTRRALLLSAEHYITLARTTPTDRFLLLAPLGYMASLPPLLCTLLTGASLHLFDLQVRGIGALSGWIAAQRITVYHSVPTVLRRLSRTDVARSSLQSVRLVRLAGETIRAADVRMVRSMFADTASIQLLMGAAETSLISEHTMGPDDVVEEGVVPVGRLAAGVEARLVDDDGREVARGATGRLIVRGRTISPGYWRNPSATAECFRRDDDGVWSYRTSDVCRWREDGLLELLGRTEEFLKIGGVRVCPALVEAALVEIPGIADAAVAAKPDERGEDRLVAYYVPAVGLTTPAGAVRAALRVRVPAGMVPAQFVRMPVLPMTPNGKVDRQALPNPRTPVRPAYRRPRDAVEVHVAAAWERVLGVEQVGLDDRFSDLGGTSMDAVEVLLVLEQTMSRRLADAAPAQHDRLEDLAAAAAREDVPVETLTALKASGRKRPFYCVHSGLGTVGTFGPLARRLDPERPFWAFQSRGLADERWPHASVDRMAETYLRELRRVDPDGPYLLGGVCMGGLVAWEMARRLRAAGKRVPLLVLIETHRPGPRGRSVGERTAFWLRHTVRVTRWGALRALGTLIGGMPPSWRPGWRQFILYHNGAAARRHRPRAYQGNIAILMGDREGDGGGRDTRLAMGELSGGDVRSAFVPGGHHDVCDGGHVDTLAGVLRGLLDDAERGAAGAADKVIPGGRSAPGG